MATHKEVQETRDNQQKVRILNHNQKPVKLKAETPQMLAKSYFEEFAKVYEIPREQLSKITLQAEDEFINNEESSFRFKREKKIMGTAVVSYVQTYFGLEVWESALNITMKTKPLSVLSSSSTAHHNIKVKIPDEKALKKTTEDIEAEVRKIQAANKLDIKCQLKCNRSRLMIFKYNAEKRVLPQDVDPKTGKLFSHIHISHPLPPVPDTISDGNFYVVYEILFTSEQSPTEKLNWIAMVEVETSAVLYLRALVDGVSAYVFSRDPITMTGDNTTMPDATTAVLNPLRDAVTLQGLVPPDAAGQSLEGEFVHVTNVLTPNIATPVESANFMYDVRTNNFAAANAYYHCDAFFRMMQDMGFVITDYFPETYFPVPVDHRGSIVKIFIGTLINSVNAQCQGNTTNDGIGLVNFLLAYKEPAYDDTEDVPDPPDLVTHPTSQGPLGMATAWRVVLHELAGHGILWSHAESPNFGFAHSAGDSVAVILNDPGSQATDKFLSFPWVSSVIDRRHDRAVASGWGWGGTNHGGGYDSEQILSTTLFRFYHSIGGGSGQLGFKEFAARFAVYLIIKAVGTLTPGSTPQPDSFETALESVDADEWNSLNPAVTYAGGAYHKVIRWAFEKQGLFQPASAVFPNNDEGIPPPVDVYINDGRNGEYPFQGNHWSCQDIWNRTSPGSGGGVHQPPIVGQPNYGYVRIKNRGGQPATNVVVKGFHCQPGMGLTYPTDWAPMTTQELPVPGGLAANDNVGVVVGPFEWTPSQVGHECMFFSVSADGDVSNIDGRITGEIPEWRLVPNDNNIAQRNVQPVNGGGGGSGLMDSFAGLWFWMHNPFQRKAEIILEPVLPGFLRKRGWALEIISTSGKSFFMQPRGRKEIHMRLIEGEDFDKELVKKYKDDAYITINAYANDILVGGMTYQIDPEYESTVGEKPSTTPIIEKCCTSITKLLTATLIIGALMVILLFLILLGQ